MTTDLENRYRAGKGEQTARTSAVPAFAAPSIALRPQTTLFACEGGHEPVFVCDRGVKWRSDTLAGQGTAGRSLPKVRLLFQPRVEPLNSAARLQLVTCQCQ